ncbi:MAG TPA: prepilin-type N-terminal cleavage/methylation domain-containing protein [Gemmatimonadales bacterium]|nr:prepilin-type N-terminal cleavage/methylation domain-containing protein [Gemmatimonadales bacterium]
MNRRGLTLLEVMIAIVILGLVVAAYLELFGESLRGAAGTRTWSQAIAYAADGMERAKLEPAACLTGTAEQLPGGFTRRCETRSWATVAAVTDFRALRVVVTLPGGGQYALERLVPTR